MSAYLPHPITLACALLCAFITIAPIASAVWP